MLVVLMEKMRHTSSSPKISIEFYDLEQDPMELVNRINEPEYEGQIQDMRMRLLRFYMETGDTVPNRRDPR